MKNLIFRSQHLKSLKGQSLFEVLVAIAVAALIMTGVVSLTTVALKNSTNTKNNALATKYAQEGIEYLREQRDLAWTNLSSRSPGSNLCLGGNPPSWGNCAQLNGIFDRRVTLSDTGFESIQAVVVVTWMDGTRTNNVNSTTRFTNWNK